MKQKEDNPIKTLFEFSGDAKGKMPLSVRERYEAMLAGNPDDEKIRAMIANFDTALSHPDENDFNRLKSALDALNLE